MKNEQFGIVRVRLSVAVSAGMWTSKSDGGANIWWKTLRQALGMSSAAFWDAGSVQEPIKYMSNPNRSFYVI